MSENKIYGKLNMTVIDRLFFIMRLWKWKINQDIQE